MQAFSDWLLQHGWSQLAATATSVTAALVISFLTGWVLKAIAKVPLFHKLKRSQGWREAITQYNVMSRVSRVIVIGVASYLVVPLLEPWPVWSGLADKTFAGLMILAVASAAGGITSALVEVLSQRDTREQRLPFKALGQGFQLTIWTYAGVAFMSVLTGMDVASVLTGLTAIGAVLVYVFRDPLLGWSAGMQVAMNDLVRTGDWISLPQRNVDGVVEDIALTTVKVRNWDKTIATLPTYSLVSEGFQNWRGMYNSGVRRIKRSIAVDAASIRHCDETMLARLRQDPLLEEFLGSVGEGEERPTNLACYRAWLEAWLAGHPKIDTKFTHMVRELQPDGRGIPVEIYAFSNDQRWVNYEHIQADIIDNAVAVLPEFDLRIFQEPTGEDLRMAARE